MNDPLAEANWAYWEYVDAPVSPSALTAAYGRGEVATRAMQPWWDRHEQARAALLDGLAAAQTDAEYRTFAATARALRAQLVADQLGL